MLFCDICKFQIFLRDYIAICLCNRFHENKTKHWNIIPQKLFLLDLCQQDQIFIYVKQSIMSIFIEYCLFQCTVIKVAYLLHI